MKEKVVTDSISELSKRFIENPLDFTVEASLVAELQRIMRSKVDEEMVSVEADYKDIKDTFTNYKEDYLKRICGPDKIHKVQIEVNIGETGGNKLVDLAVLEDGCNIRLVKGTKYFEKENIEHAVEVKFIKNKNVPPTDTKDFFENDLEKLDSLDNAKSKHLVIFSNKNIFQKKKEVDFEKKVEDDSYTKDANQRLKDLKEKRDEYDSSDIKIYHYFPEKIN